MWRGDGTDWLQQNYTDEWCRQHALPPTVPLQAHTAPIGLVFYDGKGKYGFPPEMYNQVFIAQHGSWDSDVPRGYKVSRVEWTERAEGKVTASYYDFFGLIHPHTLNSSSCHPTHQRQSTPSHLLCLFSHCVSQPMRVRVLSVTDGLTSQWM